MQMIIDLPRPSLLTEQAVSLIEEEYSAFHMGYWEIPGMEQPTDIFYVQNPDESKGHTHYFGMFFRNGSWFICKGDSFCPESGIACAFDKSGKPLVSRYRHDYVESEDGTMIDGGRAYTRTNTRNLVRLHVEGKDFVIKDVDSEESSG